MKESVRRGQYRGLFDEPDWQTRVAELPPGERPKALLMGLRVLDDARRAGDHTTTRQLLFGLAALLEIEVTEQPGAMPYALLDRCRAVRGPRRWACETLDEVVQRLHTLVAIEEWASTPPWRAERMR